MSVIDEFYSKNKYLRDGYFWILGEYANQQTKILCEDRLERKGLYLYFKNKKKKVDGK